MNAPWTSLIAAREAKGWSRFRLAAEMHINLSHLGRLERGEVSPRTDTIRRAAEALEVEVSCVAPAGSSLAGSSLVTVEQVKQLVKETVAEEFRKRGL